MTGSINRTLLLAGIAVAAVAPSAATANSPETPARSASATTQRQLLDSHVLWATIDVCNPADQANTVGIRGSMPGDGRAHDRMYMSFRLQYLNTTTNVWSDLTNASPSFVAVGTGGSPRQGGTSFQLVPVTGRQVTLRGVVDFQWRRGSKILVSAARMTSAGHKVLAGADPAGYNAANCLLG